MTMVENEITKDEATSPPDPEKEAVRAFVSKNFERCQMWVAAHGNAIFPIVKLSTGQLVWGPRNERRRLMRKRFKEGNRW